MKSYANNLVSLAKTICEDLFNYVQSFAKPLHQNQTEWIVLPVSVLDNWFKKFTHKIQLDPFFWQKKKK